MKKILITGAGGFIGGHLAKELVEQGHDVTSVDIKDVRDWEQVWGEPYGLFDAGQMLYDDMMLPIIDEYDEVYNLAADMGGIGFIENFKAACMSSVKTTLGTLAAAERFGWPRVFYSSSACVYPGYKQNVLQVDLKESDAYPADPEDGYGWEKLFSERLCRHFSEDYDIITRVARYHNIYGPNGTWKGGREKAPAAICRKIATAAITGVNEIDIWGDGEQTRSFTYIDDCIEGTMRLMASDVDEPLNIGSDEQVSINTLVDMIEDIANVPLMKRTYNLDAPLGVRGRNSENSLIKDRLNWAPSITLQEGLERTYSWVYGEVYADHWGGK